MRSAMSVRTLVALKGLPLDDNRGSQKKTCGRVLPALRVEAHRLRVLADAGQMSRLQAVRTGRGRALHHPADMRKTAKRKPRRQARPLIERPMTPQMARFVEEYVASEDLNATEATIRAGYSAKAAKVKASQLLADPRIQAAVSAAMEARAKRTQITADRVLERWWDIATADPNELIQYRRTCCNQCHDAAYDSEREPNPACSACLGQGVGSVHVKDTRKLSRAARRLYAGVKKTKDGIEVKMQDQGAALANVAKHLGMFVDRSEVQVEQVETLAVRRRSYLKLA